MGILSWFRGGNKQPPSSSSSSSSSSNSTSKPDPNSKPNSKPQTQEPAPGMNGAVEVSRPLDMTVFEFGSVAASVDKVTLSGYCPVSEELEPCRWAILPASGSDAPQFRIVF